MITAGLACGSTVPAEDSERQSLTVALVLRRVMICLLAVRPPEIAGAPPTFSSEKRGIPAKREALLISDWQRQCPRPMVQMKPVTQPADGGEGAIPYCWSWPLDFLFLAPPRAHCIMRCGR